MFLYRSQLDNYVKQRNILKEEKTSTIELLQCPIYTSYKITERFGFTAQFGKGLSSVTAGAAQHTAVLHSTVYRKILKKQQLPSSQIPLSLYPFEM